MTKEETRKEQALINRGIRQQIKRTVLELLRNNSDGNDHISQKKLLI